MDLRLEIDILGMMTFFGLGPISTEGHGLAGTSTTLIKIDDRVDTAIYSRLFRQTSLSDVQQDRPTDSIGAERRSAFGRSTTFPIHPRRRSNLSSDLSRAAAAHTGRQTGQF
jgi:hypothetical protein